MAEVVDFKGRKVLVLGNEKRRFSFGLWKAKVILLNLPAIREFVAEYDKPVEAVEREESDDVED